VSRTLLTGREALTLEVELAVDPLAVARLVPRRLSLAPGPDGAAVVSLLCFAMDGLHLDGLPRPGLSYGEALWRLRARRDGADVFFALACDLDSPLVRAVGASLIRYPVRRADFSFGDGRLLVATAAGRLSVTATPVDEVPPIAPALPVLAARGEALYEIPWRETPTPSRRWATLAVHDDSLAVATCGPSRWPARGVVMQGRLHHCGLATRVR
jgi:hypothetical protein